MSDSRWSAFLYSHPDASIFHTAQWLQALQLTYGYKPLARTTSAPGEELTNGIPFCHIASRLTGQRLVSVPFADHCHPLVESPASLNQLALGSERESPSQSYKYIELRPRDEPALPLPTSFGISQSSVLHTLRLEPDPEKLFSRFHHSCVQRRIRHAEREHLTVEVGRSNDLLNQFYSLQRRMRQKHQLPPQPINWFRNLIDCLRDQLSIYVASKEGQPVASIITLTYKQTVTYKYGCSDPAQYRLGGIIALLWQAIQAAKAVGAATFDMGRSESGQEGLIRFKDRWGSSRSSLTYLRSPQTDGGLPMEGWKMRLGQQIFARMPEPLLMMTGKVLYKHMG